MTPVTQRVLLVIGIWIPLSISRTGTWSVSKFGGGLGILDINFLAQSKMDLKVLVSMDTIEAQRIYEEMNI